MYFFSSIVRVMGDQKSRSEKDPKKMTLNRNDSVAEKQAVQKFTDNRPEKDTRDKLQDMADSSPQATHIGQLQKMANQNVSARPAIQKKGNNTGLPDQLKTGVENLSGYSMDDVKVRYNSNKPAQAKIRTTEAIRRLCYAPRPKFSQPN